MKEKTKKRERQFFDHSFEFGTREPVSKFYTVTKGSRKYYEDFLLSNCYNRRVLEYGCGTGSFAFSLSQHDAEVTGIDISEVAIKLAKAQARKVGSENPNFLMMDAEDMQFEDSSFDIVCGTAILHHLDVDKALREVARVLKPEGTAIFVEPLGHNPVINLFRKLTPSLRTKDEHPLVNRDFSLAKKFFYQADYRFFSLSSLLAVPFRNSRGFSSLLNRLDDLDKRAFGWAPLLKLLAWQVVIVLKKPRKAQLEWYAQGVRL